MNIPENILNTLTDEQKKAAEAAKSPKELLSLAKESGRELTLDELEGVAGGKICWSHCVVKGDGCTNRYIH